MTYPFNSPFGFVDHLPQQNDYVFSAMTDTPLEFNLGKQRDDLLLDDQSRQSPSGNRIRRRDRIDKDRGIMDNQKDEPEPGPPVSIANGNNLPNLWAGMMGGYPMVGMNMIMDPSGMMPTLIPPMMVQGDPNVSGPIMQPPPNISEPTNMLLPSVGPVKEIIHCKSCTLFPPNPSAPPPTTRERPPGCRTVFVGGLPDNMTEEIIMEVFERCGEITTLRLSKKTFCHIRFVFENSVDAAIFLSGYRIRIGSNPDTPNAGRLHVDYAQARDDQYEWECKQRQLQREQRHRVRMEEERLRPPSPPQVVHYTEHEATAVSEKIKQDETFTKAVQVVITWLERGDCSKRNANTFYSMIQSTNSHIRRLLGEKAQYEDELQKAKEILKGRMQGILLQ